MFDCVYTGNNEEIVVLLSPGIHDHFSLGANDSGVANGHTIYRGTGPRTIVSGGMARDYLLCIMLSWWMCISCYPAPIRVQCCQSYSFQRRRFLQLYSKRTPNLAQYAKRLIWNKSTLPRPYFLHPKHPNLSSPIDSAIFHYCQTYAPVGFWCYKRHLDSGNFFQRFRRNASSLLMTDISSQLMTSTYNLTNNHFSRPRVRPSNCDV